MHGGGARLGRRLAVKAAGRLRLERQVAEAHAARPAGARSGRGRRRWHCSPRSVRALVSPRTVLLSIVSARASTSPSTMLSRTLRERAAAPGLRSPQIDAREGERPGPALPWQAKVAACGGSVQCVDLAARRGCPPARARCPRSADRSAPGGRGPGCSAGAVPTTSMAPFRWGRTPVGVTRPVSRATGRSGSPGLLLRPLRGHDDELARGRDPDPRRRGVQILLVASGCPSGRSRRAIPAAAGSTPSPRRPAWP